MNCQEAMNLWSTYQDGELDPRFCEEIQNHLASCADCRGFFQAQGEFEAVLSGALRKRPPTASLWQRQQSALRAVFQAPEKQSASRSFWVEFLWPSRSFYGGLAVVWVLLLVANRLVDHGGTTQGHMPSAVDQAVLEEQRREFRALRMAVEWDQPPAAAHPLAPRSRRQSVPEPMASEAAPQTRQVVVEIPSPRFLPFHLLTASLTESSIHSLPERKLTHLHHVLKIEDSRADLRPRQAIPQIS